jgi:methanogenic corrinoid protein MtbC1
MEAIIEKLALVIENGKVNRDALYPPQLKGQDGADEIARTALENGIDPASILEGCMTGMKKVGERFGRNEVFVPELLMAARAMNAVMVHLKPFFASGAVRKKGAFVIGTVSGDLHDIGKKLVSMVVEGNGWEVVDLGVDVPMEKFLAAVAERPGCVLGLSALLTTTMINMEKTVKAIKTEHPDTKVLVGGAPVTRQFAEQIGADGYSPDPHGAAVFLDKLAA